MSADDIQTIVRTTMEHRSQFCWYLPGAFEAGCAALAEASERQMQVSAVIDQLAATLRAHELSWPAADDPHDAVLVA